MTPAEYAAAMARWWRDASSGDPPVASWEVKGAARVEYQKDTAGTQADAWDRAAARLRGGK